MPDKVIKPAKPVKPKPDDLRKPSDNTTVEIVDGQPVSTVTSEQERSAADNGGSSSGADAAGSNGSGKGGGGGSMHSNIGAAAANMVALVLSSRRRPRSRSKKSKQVLKFMVTLTTQIVDAVFSMPTLIQSNRAVVGASFVLLWYILGASLLGGAAAKLATFLPETLQPPGFELVAAMSHAASAVNDTLLERVAYVFQAWTYASLPVKIPLVLLAAVPLVLLLGAAYHKATGTPWSQSLLKIHAIVHRQPGANMVSEKSLVGWLLINASFFLGMFLVAVLFGLVSDEVKRSFRGIRNGSFSMRMANHIVILNYNKFTIPLLRQLSYGQRYSDDAFFSKPVVVLADMPKNDMDEEIAARLKTTLDIYTRTGNTSSMRDLAMVNAARAETVIVLHPETTSTKQTAEAVKAATAMGLSSCIPDVGPKHRQSIVMQMPDELSTSIDYMRSFGRAVTACCGTATTSSSSATAPARSTTNNIPAATVKLENASGTQVQVVQMPDGNFLDRFICHAALQPGVFKVWLKILQQGPSNVKLRVRALPGTLQGRSFAEVRRAFRDCVVIGYQRGQDVAFDAQDKEVMRAQDQLVMLSYVSNPVVRLETQSTFNAASKSASERLARPQNYQLTPKKVIVAGWDELELQDMLECFADAAPENSQVTFILDHIPEDPSPPGRVGSVRFSYTQADHPTSLKALTDAGIRTADAVVLGSADRLPPVEADALVLAKMLQVQDAVIASGRTKAPHLVAKVNRNSTMQVAMQYFDMLRSTAGGSSCPANTSSNSGAVVAPQLLSETMFRNFFEIPKDVREAAARYVKAAASTSSTTGANGSTTTNGSSNSSSSSGAAGSSGSSGAASATASGGTSTAAATSNASSSQPANAGSTPATSSTSGTTPGSTAAASNAGSSGSGPSAQPAAAASSTPPAAPASAASSSQQSSSASSAASQPPQGATGAQSGSDHVQNIMQSWSATFALTGPLQSGPLPPGVSPPLLGPPLAAPAAGSGSQAAAATGASGGTNNTAAAAATAATTSSLLPSGAVTAPVSVTAGAKPTGSDASAPSSTGNTGGNSGATSSSSSSGSSSAGSAAKTKAAPIIGEPEVFMPDDISAALLTLVAAHPDVAEIIRQLLTTRQGVELYLRNPALFNLAPGERVTYAEVCEVARLLKATAIGYVKADGQILLVPEPEHLFRYEEGDQIIVLSDDFKRRTGGWGR